MPKISVIMGVYNEGKSNYLKSAINSILNQKFTDFEFIICDDGSTDNTYEIIEEMIKSDSRIILIRNNENLGLAASLNKCLTLAKGEYIARMDSDDISKDIRFERQVEFLNLNNEYDFVGSNSELFDSNGVWGKRNCKEKPEKKDLAFGSQFMHPTIMVRKQVYDCLNGYRVSKETTRAEDYDFFMRSYGKKFKGYNIQEYLFMYREDEISYKKRTYINRIYECIVRFKGFREMKLNLVYYIFILKPLILGLLPCKLIRFIQKSRI